MYKSGRTVLRGTRIRVSGGDQNEGRYTRLLMGSQNTVERGGGQGVIEYRGKSKSVVAAKFRWRSEDGSFRAGGKGINGWEKSKQIGNQAPCTSRADQKRGGGARAQNTC